MATHKQMNDAIRAAKFRGVTSEQLNPKEMTQFLRGTPIEKILAGRPREKGQKKLTLEQMQATVELMSSDGLKFSEARAKVLGEEEAKPVTLNDRMNAAIRGARGKTLQTEPKEQEQK